MTSAGTSSGLWIVMPAYNEEHAIEGVVREWVEVVDEVAGAFTFLVVNDGSRDATGEVLARLDREIPRLRIIDQANSGHGPSCTLGYREALAGGADWIFQIDSDGQCAPEYFRAFWSLRESRDVILGRRVRRDDGVLRSLISGVVSVVVWLGTGTWLRDANVPYRLIAARALRDALRFVPSDFAFSNIALSYLLARRHPIAWVPIHFRARWNGPSTIRMRELGGHARRLFVTLRRIRAAEAGAAPRVDPRRRTR